MTDSDLRALAEAARAAQKIESPLTPWYENEEDFDAGPWYPEDKALVYLCTPARVLALLDRLDKAEAEREGLREVVRAAHPVHPILCSAEIRHEIPCGATEDHPIHHGDWHGPYKPEPEHDFQPTLCPTCAALTSTDKETQKADPCGMLGGGCGDF